MDSTLQGKKYITRSRLSLFPHAVRFLPWRSMPRADQGILAVVPLVSARHGSPGEKPDGVGEEGQPGARDVFFALKSRVQVREVPIAKEEKAQFSLF